MMLPDKLTPQGWFDYLVDELKRRKLDEYEPPVYIKKGWIRGFGQLVQDGVDPYELAIATDILAMGWSYSEDPWWALNVARLLRPIRTYGRSSAFWRYVWLSRFAKNDPESRFFAHWLSQLDSALGDPEGVDGRTERVETAYLALRDAEAKIIERNEFPAWALDWLWNRRESFSRWSR